MESTLKSIKSYWLETFTCLLLLAMVVLVSMQVILRYIFGTGIIWAEEFVRYAYVWLIFFGSVIAIRQNAHIGLDLVTEKLPFKPRRVIYCLGDVLIMFFLLIQTIYGLDIIIKTKGMLSSTLRMPMSWVYYVFPLSGILMLIEMLRLLHKHWNLEG
jgi:TRAP-type C4-dicarboxylate transport system permease small subunit